MSIDSLSGDSAARSPSAARVAGLRSQVPAGVLAIGAEPPRLTWRIEGPASAIQQGFEIEAAADPVFEVVIGRSGPIDGADSIGVLGPGGALASRERRWYRVRTRTAAGWTAWSDPLAIEAGLLEAADWRASGITLPDDPGRERQAPAPLVRTEFDLDDDVLRARLHATSLGVHEIRLNGEQVGDQLLAPGWTTYGQRLLADTYDVTSLLRSGRNAIGAVLGDGWYRGRVGWGVDDRCRYGEDVALVAQLEVELVDGRTLVVASDETWRASTAEIRRADLYDGALIDRRLRRPGWDRPGFDDVGWVPVAVVPFDNALIEPRSAAPVRVIATWPLDLAPAPDGSIRLDTGQNLAGVVRLRVRGNAGDLVVVRHAEVRNPDGSLHTLALRAARATDEYILDGSGDEVLEPAFTFHGFRHVDIETTAEVLEAEVIAISSDLPARSSFACSDPRLNRLHENVVWSARGNFVSLPTDCPQRDERLGWTGDAQAFAATGATLLDSYAFWQSWLRDLELDQDDVLGVPSVVPDVVLEGPARFGRAGWADAATVVPWAVYESYGDRDILVRQFDSMRRWVRSLEARQQPSGLLGPGMQLGDWLDPDAPPERPWLSKADSEFIANAFFAHSARLLARTAAIVGDEATERWAAALGDRVATATWKAWRDTAPGTQTGCALLICMNIAPATDRAAIGQALADLVNAADGRVATGFLGTPFVLPALAETGHIAEAYRMLLRTGVPSWLYQVEHGATTIWERWDAIRPDGSDPPGHLEPGAGFARGNPRRPHALVQPLRVRGRHRLGVPARGGDRPRRPAAWVPPHQIRAGAGPRSLVGTGARRVGVRGRGDRVGHRRLPACSRPGSGFPTARPASSSRPPRRRRR